jgi:hypothetical protein
MTPILPPALTGVGQTAGASFIHKWKRPIADGKPVVKQLASVNPSAPHPVDEQ